MNEPLETGTVSGGHHFVSFADCSDERVILQESALQTSSGAPTLYLQVNEYAILSREQVQALLPFLLSFARTGQLILLDPLQGQAQILMDIQAIIRDIRTARKTDDLHTRIDALARAQGLLTTVMYSLQGSADTEEQSEQQQQPAPKQEG